MNDISVLDLFWLILKLIAALGLVGLLALAFYLIWAGTKRAAKTSWEIVRGRNTSVTAITCFSVALLVVVTGIVLVVGYLNDHPNFLK